MTHSGIVEDIKNGWMKIRIMQTDGCASCELSSHCHTSAGGKGKVIDILDEKNTKRYKIGDEVMIKASAETGWTAVLLAFIVPFFILIVAVFGMSLFTTNEPLMAVVGLLALIPYYIIIYMLRDKISRKLSFSIIAASPELDANKRLV